MDSVEKIIHAWDPIGLFPHSPADEYHDEIARIKCVLATAASAAELGEAIYSIFAESFGPETFYRSKGECKEIAQRLLALRGAEPFLPTVSSPGKDGVLTMDDHRLDFLPFITSAESQIDGLTYRPVRFQSHKPGEHAHCALCWAPICDSEYDWEKSPEAEAFFCEETGCWICKKCYSDFAPQFHWRLSEISSKA